MSMTVDEAKRYVGGFVRVKPNNGGPHWSGGKLVSITGKKAVVHPAGSKTTEEHPLDVIQPWVSRNEQAGFVPVAPALAPAVVPVPQPPAVKGGVIESEAEMVVRMRQMEKDLEDLSQLEEICRNDYESAKAATDKARSGLAEIRKDLKARLGL